MATQHFEFTPEILDLDWHALQVTIYEYDTGRGREVKADIQAKLTSRERWGKCALQQVMSLQGRSNNYRRASRRMWESMQSHGLGSMVAVTQQQQQDLEHRVITALQIDNSHWDPRYLRRGFGRIKSQRFTPGQPQRQALNPNIFAVYDGATKTLGLQIGDHSWIETLNNRVSESQRRCNITAYSWWTPGMKYTPAVETTSERLQRFMAQAREEDLSHTVLKV